jgi:NIPSNAP
LIGFDSLEAYESYRTRLKADSEGRDNLGLANSKRFILREKPTFLEVADDTLALISQ